ncbi:MAG TPA: sodium/pantothenate symporter [Bacillaceae bacterium]
MNIQATLPLVIFFILIFAAGLYAAKYVKSSETFLQEYFLGSRQLGGFVLAMTMIATYGSASSFLGGPGAAYHYGLAWVLLAMIQVVTGYFVLMVLGKKFAIMARKYNAVTITDFVRSRYNSHWVGILSAASIVLFLFSAMTAQWVGGARLIESVAGLSYTSSLFIFAASVLVYVVIGGFRAVAITDAIQGTVMLGGTILLLAAAIVAGGGIDNIMTELRNENPNILSPYGSDKNLTPLYLSSFWILVGVGVVGLPQVSVRAMSYKDAKAMHRAILIGTAVIGTIMLGMHLAGVFARVIVPGITVPDTVMPTLALSILPPWAAGIVLAAPMAAIMSTVDSLLLLVASAIIKDVYVGYISPNAHEKKIKAYSMTATALIGGAVFLLAINPPYLLIWLNLFSFGGLEAVFLWPIVLGLYWRKANKHGALSCMLTGMGSYMAFHFLWPEPFGMHTVVLPIVLSLVIFIAVSLFTQKAVR